MAKVVVYSKEMCPFCVHAKTLLNNKGVAFEEIRVDEDPEQLKIMMERSGQRTVPQIFINDQSIGGFTDMQALDQQGKLDELLAQEGE